MDKAYLSAKALASIKRSLDAVTGSGTKPQQVYNPAQDTPAQEGSTWDQLSKDPKWKEMGFTDKALVWMGAGVPKVAGAILGEKLDTWRESLGQAAEKFSGSWMGKALIALDVTAEGVERVVGLGNQWLNDPSVEKTKDMQSYWQAGSFAYDFARLPEFNFIYNEDGSINRLSVTMDDDLPGAAGLITARKKIQEYVSQGMERKDALAQVRTDMYADMGMLSIKAAKQDMIGHIVLDPANYFLGWLKPIDRIKAKAITAQYKKTSIPLWKALTKMEIDDVVKIASKDSKIRNEVLEGLASKYKGIEGIDLVQDVFSEAKFTDTLLEMQKNNQLLTMGDKLTIFFTGGQESFFKYAGVEDIPWWGRNSMEVLAEGWEIGKNGKRVKIPLINRFAKAFTLTDDAKAWEVMYAITDNIMAKMPKNNPAAAMEFLEDMYKGMLSPKYGHAVYTVQGRAAQTAVRNSIIETRKLFSDFESYLGERQILNTLSEVLGPKVSEYDIMKWTVKHGPDYVMQRLEKMAANSPELATILKNLDNPQLFPVIAINDMPLDDLGYAIKAYKSEEIIGNLNIISGNDMPYTTEMFYRYLDLELVESIDTKVVTMFGLQEMGMVRKLSDAMKAGESLVFLKVNPGFAVRNFLNNELTMIGRGLSPFVGKKTMEEFVQSFGGYSPMKMTEAFTMAGDTFIHGARTGLYQKGSHIQDALVGERKFLDQAREWIGDIEVPADFGELARKTEESASRRAFYQGFQQGWNDYFWRPGHGFNKASEVLSPQLMEAMGPQMIKKLDGIISDIRSEGDFKKLLAQNAEFSPKYVMGQVEAQLQEEFGLNMPQETVEFLRQGLSDTLEQATRMNDPSVIDNFFAGARGRLKTHLDTLSAERAAARVAYADGLVAGLGQTRAVPVLLGDSFDDLMHAHIGYSMRMAQIDMSDLSPAARRAKWQLVLQENRDYWNRHWNRLEDTVKGIKAGLGPNAPLDPRFTKGVKAYRKTWDDFFDMREADYKLWDGVFEADGLPEGFKFKSWDDMKKQHDIAYDKAFKDEVKILEAVDGMMVKAMGTEGFGDMKLAPAFANWRKSMIELRKQSRVKTQKFMRAVQEIDSPVKRAAAYKKYFQDAASDWKKYSVSQREGLAAMYGDPDIISRLTKSDPLGDVLAVNQNMARAWGVDEFGHFPQIMRYAFTGEGYGKLSDEAMEWFSKFNIGEAEDAITAIPNEAWARIPNEIAEEILEKRRKIKFPAGISRTPAETRLINSPHHIPRNEVVNYIASNKEWSGVITPSGEFAASPLIFDHGALEKAAGESIMSKDKSYIRLVGENQIFGDPRYAQSIDLRMADRSLTDTQRELLTEIIDINEGKLFVDAFDTTGKEISLTGQEAIDFINKMPSRPEPTTSGVVWSKSFDNFWRPITGKTEGVTAARFPNLKVPPGTDPDAPLRFFAGRSDDSVRGGVVFATTDRRYAENYARGPNPYVEEIYFNTLNAKHLTTGQEYSYAQALWEGNPNKKALAEAKRWMKEMQDFGIQGVYYQDTFVVFKEANTWRNKPGGPRPFTGYEGPHVPMKPGVWDEIHKGGPKLDVGYDQAQITKGDEMMDALEMQTRKAFDAPPTIFDNMLDDSQKLELQGYIEKTQGQFNEARVAATHYAGWRRDTALLNYRRRYKFDANLALMMPYSFWMTHSLARWALHSIDRPAMLTTYLRFKKMMNTAGSLKEGFPSRLQNSIRVPLLDPPDWMGDTFWADPLRALLPFDQMAFPYEKYVQQKQDASVQTENYIRRMVEDGKITEEMAMQAVQTKQGEIWELASYEVQDMQGPGEGAWDIANTFSSMHAPLQWGFNYLTGTEENIGPLTPGARARKQFLGLLGINPVTDQQGFGTKAWDVGSSIRQELGLHPFDKWEDYRIDRAIVNMVAYDPAITPEMGLRAMIDRTGPLFQQAAIQAAKQYARGSVVEGTTKEKVSSAAAFVLNQAGIPVYTYPEGEEQQRMLKDDFGRAYEAEYDDGDAGALNRFFKEHPEYEARLALWKEPEQRMKNFMVDQMWNLYAELPTVQKRQLVDGLGEDFQKKFLNTATRNYGAVSNTELYTWLKMAGADPPGSLNIEAAPIEMAPDDVAMRAQVFYDMRNQKFPDYIDMQNEFFDLDEESPDRYNHRVREYWAWREDFFHRNPEIVPYVDDDYQLKYPTAEARNQAMSQGFQFNPEVIETHLSPGMYNIAVKAAQGQPISTDIQAYLTDEAHKLGISYAKMLDILR